MSIISCHDDQRNAIKHWATATFPNQDPLHEEERLNDQIKNVGAFLHQHNEYNAEMVFLIDMKLPSKKKRFFVYDYTLKKIMTKGIVAHGCGSVNDTNNELHFSNIENSNCTSLGHYRIGASYMGRFGKAYKLHGLDPSNDQAFKRNIVLHSYWQVPYIEQPFPICLSQGCPMVSETFFKEIEQIIDASNKPILLSIYY